MVSEALLVAIERVDVGLVNRQFGPLREFGHGRSSQPWDGNEMDTYVDDLAQLIESLDLRDVILVGHSTGGGEVTRYIGRHGTARVAKALLLGAIPPLMLKTPANPSGTPIEAFDALRASITTDRSQFYQDLSVPFYGANRPDATVSQRLRDTFWLWSMQVSVAGTPQGGVNSPLLSNIYLHVFDTGTVPITGRSNTSSTAQRSALEPSSTARTGRVTSRSRSRSPTSSSVTRSRSQSSPRPVTAVLDAVDVDAQCHHAAVIGEVHPVDHQRHQIHAREVRRHQLGQSGLGRHDEPARDRRLRRCPGALLNTSPDRLQSNRVAPGRQPSEHPLHRHPTEYLSPAKQLIRRHRQLPAAITGAHPRPRHWHLTPAQGHRPGTVAMPGGHAYRIVTALHPALGGHIFFHQRGQHLQPGAHRQS